MRRATLAVSGALVLIGVAAACGPSGPPPDPESVRRGREVYVFETCGSCHAADGSGTKKAPPLARLRRHWSADDLTAYLRDPHGYPKDDRLRGLAGKYRENMAGLPAAGKDRLRDLVAFLFSL